MRNLIKKILKESEEDFEWVNLPKEPKDDSYAERVRYALENTEFNLVYHKLGTGRIVVQIKERAENPITLIMELIEDFTRKNVLNQSQRTLLILSKQLPFRSMMGIGHELRTIIDIRGRLHTILKQID